MSASAFATSLNRFIQAQQTVYDEALSELETGRKRTVTGRLQEFAAELDSELRIVETESGETVRIPVADIMKARLEVEL